MDQGGGVGGGGGGGGGHNGPMPPHPLHIVSNSQMRGYRYLNVVDIQLNLIIINAIGFFMPKRKSSMEAYSAPPYPLAERKGGTLPGTPPLTTLPHL